MAMLFIGFGKRFRVPPMRESRPTLWTDLLRACGDSGHGFRIAESPCLKECRGRTKALPGATAEQRPKRPPEYRECSRSCGKEQTRRYSSAASYTAASTEAANGRRIQQHGYVVTHAQCHQQSRDLRIVVHRHTKGTGPCQQGLQGFGRHGVELRFAVGQTQGDATLRGWWHAVHAMACSSTALCRLGC